MSTRFAIRCAIALALPAALALGQGHEHVAIYSTEAGGGSITTDWNFETRKVHTFKSACDDEGQCLFTTINPAFLAPDVDGPSEGLHRLDDETRLSLVLIARDAVASLRVNGRDLEPGDTALLGTAPDIHNHPSWQLFVPETEEGEWEISYKFITNSAQYAESPVYTSIVTNIAPTPASFTATPTPSPTPTPPACPGDCDGDGAVRIDELVRGVHMALDGTGVCDGLDSDNDQAIDVADLIRAVLAALHGCRAEPTPLPATLAFIQDSIFTPSCALSGCHNAASALANLVLEPGTAHDQLAGVAPETFAAQLRGYLRVDPGKPENSFLLIKLEGPSPDLGSQMPPLPASPLSPAQIQAVRDWIAQGAPE